MAAAFDPADFAGLSPTTLADLLDARQIVDPGLRPLWTGMPRLAGRAFTVRCEPGDHLMLHAAIYDAPPGSVLVVECGSTHWALAGGNVCAVAQRRGIRGFVVDGAVRDLAEIRAMRFSVFARGVTPKAAAKNGGGSMNQPVSCGGVRVVPGDSVVADEEGIVIVPAAESARIFAAASVKSAAEAAQSLDAWELDHRTRIAALLLKQGIRK